MRRQYPAGDYRLSTLCVREAELNRHRDIQDDWPGGYACRPTSASIEHGFFLVLGSRHCGEAADGGCVEAWPGDAVHASDLRLRRWNALGHQRRDLAPLPQRGQRVVTPTGRLLGAR